MDSADFQLKRNNHMTTRYLIPIVFVFRATKFDSNFPCAVPSEVISHLPEQKQKQIQTHG